MFSLDTGSMLFDVKGDPHNICQRRKSGTEIFTYHPTGPSCIVVDITNTEPYILINPYCPTHPICFLSFHERTILAVFFNTLERVLQQMASITK